MTGTFAMATINDPGLGDGRAEVGSEQWAKRVRSHMGILTAELPHAPRGIAGYMRLLRQHEGWRLLTDKRGQPFASLDEFCETPRPWGLGMKLADLERWIDRSGPAGAPLYWNPRDGEIVEVHPAANLFPMMEEAALAELAADIAANGQREPVVLWEGKVIDGRNRLAACERVGVVPTFTALASCPDPVAYVLSLNLHRRHLDTSQRAMVAAKALPLLSEQAKARQVMRLKHGNAASTPVPANLPEREQGEAREHVATMANVSPRTVETAAKVIKTGTPELIAAVEAGTVTVSAAADVATLPAEEQRDAVAGGKDAVKAATKKARDAKAKKPTSGTVSDYDAMAAMVAEAKDGKALENLSGRLSKLKLTSKQVERIAALIQKRHAELRAPAEEPEDWFCLAIRITCRVEEMTPDSQRKIHEKLVEFFDLHPDMARALFDTLDAELRASGKFP